MARQATGRGFAPLQTKGFIGAYRFGTRSRRGEVVVIEVDGPQRADGSTMDRPPRVGVVAGRKVGHAVHRNRAKRRLREAASRVDLTPGTDYVIVAMPGIIRASFDDIVRWLSEALEANMNKRKGPRS